MVNINPFIVNINLFRVNINLIMANVNLFMANINLFMANILSVNEKLPVLKFRYFGKYVIQLFGYCYVHVSGQQQAGLER